MSARYHVNFTRVDIFSYVDDIKFLSYTSYEECTSCIRGLKYSTCVPGVIIIIISTNLSSV